MSESGVEEAFLDAARLERRYEWPEAADLYGQALIEVDEGDFFRRGEVQEKIGYSLRRAAFQAESKEEFRDRMQRAIEAYEKGYGFYGKLTEERGAPWMLRCRAIINDLNHWLASDPSEKRGLLHEALELEEKALAGFWDIGNKLEYGRTYNELPLVHYNSIILEWDRQARARKIEKAIEWSEKAVAVLSEQAAPHETARARFVAAFYSNLFNYYFVADPEIREKNQLEGIERLKSLIELSQREGDYYLVGLNHWIWGFVATSMEEQIQHYEKALECGEETRDVFLKGIAQDFLAYRIHWRALGIDDPGYRLKLVEDAMEFYEKGQQNLSLISYLFRQAGVVLPPGGYSEHYHERAGWETDVEKKLDFLDKAEKDGLKALKMAEDSDIPAIIDQMCHYLSKTLQAQASIVPDTYSKRSLLDVAMKYRQRSIEIEERLFPFNHWRIGVWYNYLALIQMEFANIEQDLKEKRNLLEDSVQSMEKCLENVNKLMLYTRWGGIAGNLAVLIELQDRYEIILSRMYDVTNDQEFLRKAIGISRKTIESASKIDMNSRIAESYWKIAKKYDVLGEHIEAANNFRHASESYAKAAEKIPQLKDFYQDHATYMRAWSEIERAKFHHKEKKYGMAKDRYEKAAELHKATERWNHLGSNYLAWAQLEEAEDLSRSEQTRESRDIFQQAASLFSEAMESIKDNLKTFETGEERQIAEGLVKASNVRREYCLGTMALEEARMLDRQGDHLVSSDRYGKATERFKKVIDAMEREHDRRELWPIVYLSQAWQKMMMAEARTVPRLYEEAANLFEQAKEYATDQPTSLLAHAHSSFCRALEAGSRFETNRDPAFFSTAKNHIEAATSHYLRAGHQIASDYARATGRLIDAYMYTFNAQVETDPEKKARLYQMAESLLQASADSYTRAMHPEKKEEVLRIIESVKEDREIAASLMAALHAPLMTSTTTSFSTPTPTYEQPVGLERFEYADVQANLILGKRDAKAGEDLDLEIELVNAGKAPAQLIKINEIIPTGFEVVRAPEICSIEDSHLDMRGRTLPPLKTANLKLIVRPQGRGDFHIKPRVLYLDESGRYKHHEPQPVTLIVRPKRLRGPPI